MKKPMTMMPSKRLERIQTMLINVAQEPKLREAQAEFTETAAALLKCLNRVRMIEARMGIFTNEQWDKATVGRIQ